MWVATTTKLTVAILFPGVASAVNLRSCDGTTPRLESSHFLGHDMHWQLPLLFVEFDGDCGRWYFDLTVAAFCEKRMRLTSEPVVQRRLGTCTSDRN
jgi:hypothetical protein